MKKLIPILLVILMMTVSAIAQNLQISGGNDFSAAVCDNQQVFVWGENNSGQLGLTAADVPVASAYSNTPTSVLRGNISNVAGGTTYGNLPAIRQVDAGSGAHILGLSCASQVWSWGNNANGQLGRNTTTTSAVPQRVLRGAQAANVNVNDPNGIFLNNIFYVSGGNNSSFALETGTGKVLAWGQNTNGELGDGTLVDKSTPVYVLTAAATPLTNIIQIEGGDDCTYALDANGNVWSWGDNSGNKLGRPGAGNQVYAARVVQGDPLNNGYSSTPTPTVYLNGIVQISGGDTHCLALDQNGNVWSFGGDWGEGQLGRSGGSVYQDDARKVSIPGLATYATSNAQFLGNGVDGKAVYVSAGQANSAVVMANGKVVTFGARGLYNSGSTTVAPPATAISCPTPAGDMIPAGSLGDGNAACNSGSCNGKATQFSRTPVYVLNQSTGTALTGITQVSDGDAWFYAISSTGAAYVWGWNRRGELGTGDYTDKCSAVSFTLPTGCAFSDPCPGRPKLGPDVVTCPVFSTTLNSNVPQTYTSYKYTWEYRAGTSGAWTALSTAGNLVNYTPANSLGQYRVTVLDNRGTVPFLCAACPTYMDTITFTQTPNPYTTSGCTDNTASLAQFQVNSPAGTKIKWYTNNSGGSPLNPSDSNSTIVVPFASTNTTTPGCARALFADDVTSFTGVLRPGTTVATAPCAGSGTTEAGNRSPLMIEVNQNLTLKSVNFIQPNNTNPYSATYTVKIYSNDPANGYNCGGCNPSNSKLGQPGTLLYTSTGIVLGGPANAGAVVRTIPTSYALTGTSAAPVKYWIYVDGGDITYFNGCNPAVTQNATVATPIWTTPEVSSPTGMRGLIAIHDGSPAGSSNLFNLTFDVGTSYSCSRILVCITGTCTLPVDFLSFTAQQNAAGVDLNWTTAFEKNSSYFSVEKSSDGIHFNSIGTVNAAGNSSSIIHYLFTDNDNESGITYYRIVEYDHDGKATHSEIVSVESNQLQDIKVIPNPNSGKFNVTIAGSPASIHMVLFNTLGEELLSMQTDHSENSFDIQNLPSGVYFLHITSGTKSWIRKVVKQ
ncbi:MAG: T9SS type A sorting domain-containing protein [Cytophagaceae bacterium]